MQKNKAYLIVQTTFKKQLKQNNNSLTVKLSCKEYLIHTPKQ